jgi:hypothetical protein
MNSKIRSSLSHDLLVIAYHHQALVEEGERLLGFGGGKATVLGGKSFHNLARGFGDRPVALVVKMTSEESLKGEAGPGLERELADRDAGWSTLDGVANIQHHPPYAGRVPHRRAAGRFFGSWFALSRVPTGGALNATHP